MWGGSWRSERGKESKAAWARERHRADTAPKELGGWGPLEKRPCKSEMRHARMEDGC